MAEAFFDWANYDQAGDWLQKAAALPDIPTWESAKVPILILNATSLNTGHNCQFTAPWMGEPPSSIDRAIDANYRLRRMHYDDAPPPHNEVR